MTAPQETTLGVRDPAADIGDTEPAGDDDRSDKFDDQQRALARLEAVADQAQDFARRAKAPNTLKAYRNDWDDFCAWCGLHRRYSCIGVGLLNEGTLKGALRLA